MNVLNEIYLLPLDAIALLVGVVAFFLLGHTKKACAHSHCMTVHEALLASPSPIMAIKPASLEILEVNSKFVQCFDSVPANTSLLQFGLHDEHMERFLQDCIERFAASKNDTSCVLPSEIATFLLWHHAASNVSTPVHLEVFAAINGEQGLVLYAHLAVAGGSLANCIQQYYNSTSGKVYFLRDIEGRLLNCNSYFEEIMNLSLPDMFGKKLEDLPLPADIIKSIVENGADVLESTAPVFFEFVYVDAQRVHHQFLSQNYPDLHPNGTRVGTFTVWKNISQSKFATLLLKRQEALLVAAIDATMCLFSTSSDMETMAQEVFTILGETIAADFIDVWRNHDNFEDGLLATQVYRWLDAPGQASNAVYLTTLSYENNLLGWDKILASGECINSLYDTFVVNKENFDNKHNQGSVLVVPILYNDTFWGFIRIGVKNPQKRWSTGEEAVLRSVGLFLISTMQQKQVQDALYESKRRFQDVISAAGEIVWELDAQGYIAYISERVQSLLGYTPEELLGTRFEDISEGEFTYDITGRMFQQSVSRGSFNTLEHACKTKNGDTVWMLTSGLLLTGDDGITGMRGTSLDITQSKKDAERLSQTLTALEAANSDLALAAAQAKSLAQTAELASKAKTDFIANMSHELRTPLNAILGMAYLAQKTQLSPKQQDYLKKINSAGESLLGLVNNILDFAKIESGRAELANTPFSLAEVFNNLAAIKGVAADTKHLQLTFFVDRNIPDQLVGDPIKFGQAIGNIVENAIKFSTQGCVGVRCLLKEQHEDRVVLRIIVQDEGVGISPEKLENLFTPFSQADSSLTRRFGGTGIGLGLAKKVIELAGGTIHVESSIGQGTTVTIEVPLAINLQLSSLQVGASPLQGAHVVLVEPNEHSRSLLTEMLVNFGCNVAQFDEMQNAFVHFSKTDKTPSAAQFCIIPQQALLEEDGGNLVHLFETMSLDTLPEVIAIVPLSHAIDAPVPSKRGKVTFLYQPVLSELLYQVLCGHISLVSPNADASEVAKSLPYFPNARALLVEDNLINQQIGLELLRDVGITVSIAQNGQEAIDMLEAAPQTAYDIVLMDLQMPELDGYSATEHIRKNDNFNGVPIVAMTAHATEEEQQRCFALGMNEHIAKPLDIRQLYAVLKRWLPPVSVLLARSATTHSGEKETNAVMAAKAMDLVRDRILSEGLPEKLQRLVELLKDDDAEACSAFSEIELTLKAIDSSAAAQVKRALDVFDFAAALVHLEPMAHGLRLFNPYAGAL